MLVSHPTGNTFTRALIDELYLQQKLNSYYTTLNWDSESWINQLLPSQISKDLTRRSYRVHKNLIRSRPLRELVRLTTGRFNWPWLHKSGQDWANLDAVYWDLDNYVAGQLHLESPTHLHCYEDGALDTFTVGKGRGIHCSYELPIAHWNTLHQLLSEEAEKRPDWAPTLVFGNDSGKKLERKDRELELADTVVVPSQFVERSLPQSIRSRKHVVVANFGTPSLFSRKEITKPSPNPMRFLFAGSMGQRKGLADLLDAFNRVGRKDVELVVMGSPLMPIEFYRKTYSDFKYEAPRSHVEVLELMRTCHVLALPSIAEGRALVQQEAMSQGMALMVTPNAGGEDLVIEGKTGHIVPPSSPDAIEQAIHKFADYGTQVHDMGLLAQNLAKEYTWEKYSARIIESFTSRELF